MIYAIQTRGGEKNPHYVQRTALDGRDYLLRFEWNGRDAHWYLSIADENEDPIVSGIKLVANWPLLWTVTDSRRPPGELYALDMAGTNADPGLEDLGTRVSFVYFDAEELGR